MSEQSAEIDARRPFTVDDLGMGGCIPAAAHYEHLAVGNPLCRNQPGHDLFGLGKFGTIVADPPWAFTFSTRKSEAGNNGWRGSTDRHYANLSMRQLRDLPIPDVAADDCVLWLWAVNAMLDDACNLLKHWGFDYKNTLTWAKTASHGGPAVGMGFWMRGATEHLLLGVKGKPKPLRRNQPTWFAAADPDWRDPVFSGALYEPPGRHSAKPDRAYEVIETLTPGPYLDVFARRQRDGWTCWGDEAPSIIPPGVES
jgi:N6-adenosine-specific RNA methylase IME4